MGVTSQSLGADFFTLLTAVRNLFGFGQCNARLAVGREPESLLCCAAKTALFFFFFFFWEASGHLKATCIRIHQTCRDGVGRRARSTTYLYLSLGTTLLWDDIFVGGRGGGDPL